MIGQVLRRTVWAVLTLIAGVGCDRGKPAAEQPPLVRTDLPALRQYLALPAGDFRCKWTVRAAAAGGMAPGPSDASLVAFVELTDAAWRDVAVAPATPEAEDTIPPARDNQIILSDLLAKQLLPDTMLQKLERFDAQHVVLQGSPLLKEQLARMPFRASRAIRIGDALLLLAATS